MRRGCLFAGLAALIGIVAGCWALDPDLALLRAGFYLGRELAAMLAQGLEALADMLRQLQG
jgi:hypothetical protein